MIPIALFKSLIGLWLNLSDKSVASLNSKSSSCSSLTFAFTGLGAGTYNVFVKNGDNSCLTAYPTNPVILTVPNAPSITNVAFVDPTDCGVLDGSITVTASGGTGPLQYSKDGGTNWETNNGLFTGLDASQNPYQIMVRNANQSCEVTGQLVNLTDKVAPTIAGASAPGPHWRGETQYYRRRHKSLYWSGTEPRCQRPQCRRA